MEEERDCCLREAEVALCQARQEGLVAARQRRYGLGAKFPRQRVIAIGCSHGDAASDQGGMHSKAPVAYALLATVPIGQQHAAALTVLLVPSGKIGFSNCFGSGIGMSPVGETPVS